MSWFSDLTSKAEALLERLDQDAAQALQNPENILKGSNLRLLKKDPRHNDQVRLLQEDKDSASQLDVAINRPESAPQQEKNHIDERSNDVQSAIQSESNDYSKGQISHAEDTDHNGDPSADNYNQNLLEQTADVHHETSPKNSNPVNSNKHQVRKFKFQTSKLKLPEPNANSTFAQNRTINNTVASKTQASPIPEIDDIRSRLREYSLAPTSNNRRHQDQDVSDTVSTNYLSYYDDQPNIIRDNDNEGHRNGSLVGKRNESSESFSIDVPEGFPRTPVDIADQILTRSTMKRKSTFSIHKVINRLAYQSGQHYILFDDKTKVKFRRAQMRAASYLRRLNYYFRAYPKMKYWIIGYLIVLQLLVVYVLFFYQSSGSSTYLSTQVKEQQEGLFRPAQPVGAANNN